MRSKREKSALGCLYIGEMASGKSVSSGPSLFQRLDGEELQLEPADGCGLWDRLQLACQAVLSRCELCGIVAEGTGCAAALALAEQLSVDRLVLCAPKLSVPGGREPASRQTRRIAAFARRNLSLCVADTLILQRAGSPLPRGGWSPRCRVERCALAGDEMYTIREIASKKAILRFLHTGDFPKTLAQNREMCIIDG